MGAEAGLQVFLRAADEEGVRRIVARIRRAFPLPLGEEQAERYWKDPALYDVFFPVSTPPGTTESAVFALLKAAWLLGGPWTVSGGAGAATTDGDFEAIAAKDGARLSVPGLEWARIHLRLSEGSGASPDPATVGPTDGQARVETREDFVRFLGEMSLDLRNRPQEWENGTLERFLEAWAAWVDDLPGWYANRGEEMPEQPDWKLLADMVMAARVYE